jgi:PAS domain-containing protein
MLLQRRRIAQWDNNPRMASPGQGSEQAHQAQDSSEQNFRLIVDTIPALVNTLSATGEAEFANQQLLDYFGKTLEELKGWAVSRRILDAK